MSEFKKKEERKNGDSCRGGLDGPELSRGPMYTRGVCVRERKREGGEIERSRTARCINGFGAADDYVRARFSPMCNALGQIIIVLREAVNVTSDLFSNRIESLIHYVGSRLLCNKDF